jgi:hypothetical protein
VLASTISAQGLQPIPRRHPKISHAASTVEHQQFLARSSAHVRTQPFHRHILENRFGALVGERSDHDVT